MNIIIKNYSKEIIKIIIGIIIIFLSLFIKNPKVFRIIFLIDIIIGIFIVININRIFITYNKIITISIFLIIILLSIFSIEIKTINNSYIINEKTTYEVPNYTDVNVKDTYIKKGHSAKYKPLYHGNFSYNDEIILTCGEDLPNEELKFETHGNNQFGDSTMVYLQDVGQGSSDGYLLSNEEYFNCIDGKQLRIDNDDGNIDIYGTKKEKIANETYDKEIPINLIQEYDKRGNKTTQTCYENDKKVNCKNWKYYDELNKKVDDKASLEHKKKIHEKITYNLRTEKYKAYKNGKETEMDDLQKKDFLLKELNNKITGKFLYSKKDTI